MEEVWRRYQSTEKRTSLEARRTRRAADYSKSDAKPFTTRAELQRGLQAANAHVSLDTIGRALPRVGIHSRSPRKTPLLKTGHVIARLKFSREHLEKPAHFWNKILWSDETKLELFGGNSSRRVWRNRPYSLARKVA